jgi:hypothetical protein
VGEARDKVKRHSGVAEHAEVGDLGRVGSVSGFNEAVDEGLRADTLLTVEIHKVDYSSEVEALHAGHGSLFKAVNCLFISRYVEGDQSIFKVRLSHGRSSVLDELG